MPVNHEFIGLTVLTEFDGTQIALSQSLELKDYYEN